MRYDLTDDNYTTHEHDVVVSGVIVIGQIVAHSQSSPQNNVT